MRLDIVTAEKLVYSDEVSSVVAPGAEGQLGILPNHAPLLTSLMPGELKVLKDGEETNIAVSGGFLEVLKNVVTVLADTAERAEDIDVERAEAALKRAQDKVNSSGSDLDLERAIRALKRSQARVFVSKRKRSSKAK
ncbi:MAG: ATP synthase F1 subunit epsilon [Dehalococcoidia bacterium]|nr:ATP synthase F1 subunit epsilon [Dehalococcoidia bacterium]MQG16260.1 F0F1 ATP synthase subunit epsilon [SAR202 cluster bacterium]|tara:strand:+ start:23903 stop:24313 length:411 start_codon:yes stop_codon:yes gene_type:complete